MEERGRWAPKNRSKALFAVTEDFLGGEAERRDTLKRKMMKIHRLDTWRGQPALLWIDGSPRFPDILQAVSGGPTKQA